MTREWAYAFLVPIHQEKEESSLRMKTERIKTKRKVLSFLLSVALLVSMLPTSGGQVAKAADGYPVTYNVKTDADGAYIQIKGMSDNYTDFIEDDTLTIPSEIEGKPVKDISKTITIEAKNVVFPNTLGIMSAKVNANVNTETIYFMYKGILKLDASKIMTFWQDDGSLVMLKDVYFYPYDIEPYYEEDGDIDIGKALLSIDSWDHAWEHGEMTSPMTLHVASPAIVDKLNADETAKKQIDEGRLIVVQDLEADYDSKMILPSTIKKAEAYTEDMRDNYSKASWAALQTALTVAKAVTAETSDEEAKQALDSLQAALSGLVFVGDLNDAIASAEELEEEGYTYTNSTWAAVVAALEAARNAGDGVSSEEVAALEKALEEAVAALVKKRTSFLQISCSDAVTPAAPVPEVLNNTSGGEVTYEYFTDEECQNPFNADDPSVPPTVPGTYYVRGTAAATEDRLSATAQTSFTVYARSGEGFSLSDDGVLTITDTAALESDEGNPPWQGVKPEVVSVELAPGVEPTKIGANRFSECRKLTSFTVPDTVTSLGENCFQSTGLTEIIIPDGVTSLGNRCFGYASLTEITLPDSVTSLGVSCFYQNYKYTDKGLTKITIPDGVTSIPDSCFSGNGKLREVTLPAGLKSIDGAAFRACESLDSLEIPSSLETLGGGAFQGSGIRQLIIPESVTAIGGDSFYGLFEGCTRLSVVAFKGTEYTVDSLGGIYNMFLGVPDSAAVLCDGTTYETLSSYSETLDSTHKWPEGILRKPQEYAAEQKEAFQSEKQAVSGLVEADYTAESWNALQAALAQAEELSAAEGDDFDKAIAQTEARRTLAEGAMPCLQDALNKTKAFLAGDNIEKDYDTESDSWWDLQDAVDDAERIIEENTADATEIMEKIQALKTAEKGLALRDTDTAKAALDNAVAAANALVESDYTPESWKALQDALAEVEAEIASGKISRIEAVQKKVEDAMAALGKMPTDEAEAALEAAVAAATKDLKESDYTPESWKALQDALAEAEALKGTGTISQIQAAQKKVQDAATALVKKDTGSSTNPSADPSAKPSTSPSTKPSTSPSSNPGVKPSTAPGTKPTAKPQAPKVKKVTVKKVKSTKKKTIQVQWKKLSGVTGYQVQTALDKKFKKGKKNYTVKKAKTTKKTIKKLKSKKKYFVRVRAYKTLNGKKYYGSWSKVKSVKVK